MTIWETLHASSPVKEMIIKTLTLYVLQVAFFNKQNENYK